MVFYILTFNPSVSLPEIYPPEVGKSSEEEKDGSEPLCPLKIPLNANINHYYFN
jgi:hypothetical protein